MLEQGLQTEGDYLPLLSPFNSEYLKYLLKLQILKYFLTHFEPILQHLVATCICSVSVTI